MRRNNFWIGALVAIVTFVSLSAFVHRPWGWNRGWHGRWDHDHCYYDHHYRHHHNSDRKEDPKQPVKDSTTF